MAGMVPPRRPHTVAPTSIMEVSSDELLALTDQQLMDFADQQLSMVFQPGTSRNVLLSKIIEASLVVADG